MEILSTSGLSFHLEKLIDESSERIYIVSPYLKIKPIIIEKLIQKAKKGVEIIIIYGKSKLLIEESDKIKKIPNLKIYFNENLHAKAFANEESVIIGSMNLYDFSQRNNLELGVLINKNDNENIYLMSIDEIQSIENVSELEFQNGNEDFSPSNEIEVNNLEMYLPFVNRFDTFKVKIIKYSFQNAQYCKVQAYNDKESYIFSNDYGFVTINAPNGNNLSKEIGQNIQFIVDRINPEFRVFDHKFRICIYYPKEWKDEKLIDKDAHQIIDQIISLVFKSELD